MHEPHYRRASGTAAAWKSLGEVMRTLFHSDWLRGLVVVYLAVVVYTGFQADVSQLYLLLYTNSAIMLGLVWAAYAFVAAGASYLAHHFHARTHGLVVAFVSAVVLMAAWNHPTSMAWFLVAVFFTMMLTIHLETRFQHEVPSHVRASTLSALSMMGRIVTVPAMLGLGYATQRWGAFVMVQLLAIFLVGLLAFWFAVVRRHQPRLADQSVLAD